MHVRKYVLDLEPFVYYCVFVLQSGKTFQIPIKPHKILYGRYIDVDGRYYSTIGQSNPLKIYGCVSRKP